MLWISASCPRDWGSILLRACCVCADCALCLHLPFRASVATPTTACHGAAVSMRAACVRRVRTSPTGARQLPSCVLFCAHICIAFEETRVSCTSCAVRQPRQQQCTAPCHLSQPFPPCLNRSTAPGALVQLRVIAFICADVCCGLRISPWLCNPYHSHSISRPGLCGCMPVAGAHVDGHMRLLFRAVRASLLLRVPIFV